MSKNMTDSEVNKAQLISIVLPDLRGGGAERLHINLAHVWLKAGYRVEFVLLQAKGELQDLLPDGVNIHVLGVDRLRFAILPLCRYLRQTKPDVTLAAMWPLTSITVLAWQFAARPGKLFLSDHTQLSIACLEELGTPGWVLRGSIRMTYPWATGIVTVSKGVKDDLCALGALKLESVSVIYNPAAIEPRSCEIDADLRTKLWGDDEGYNVLSVGTLKAQKDHKTLLEAFARLPAGLRAKLVILGDGALKDELLDLRNQLQLDSRVNFAGFVTDPADWYRTADLFVLSSRWEGFANVIVEALSFGIPVVSTDCRSGPAEILEGGRYGTLVPVRDPEALSQAISKSCGHPTDRELLVSRSRDFSVEAIALQYLRYMGLEGQNGNHITA